MIVSVIVVGLVAALTIGARGHLKPLVIIGVVVSLGWGLAVASDSAFVGGSLLAFPNYVIGVLLGLGVRRLAISTDRLRQRHQV